MDIKKYIIAFFMTTASAGQFDVEVGRTFFGRQEDGTWYQQRFEHDLDVEDRFLGLGYRSRLNDSWDWRIGYADLGEASFSSIATTDTAYLAGCSGPPECPIARFSGKGGVRGFSLTAIQSGDGIFAEAGLYAFRATSTVINTSIPYGESRSYHHIPRWQIATRLGLGYRIGNFELLASHYLVEAKGPAETEDGQPVERIPGLYDVNKKHPGSFAFTLRVNI